VRKSDKITQIFGSRAKERRFDREDRRLHRSAYRMARQMAGA